MADPVSVTLVAPDISCAHCVSTIEEEIGGLTGVQSVMADLATKHVTVAYDEADISQAQLEAALADAGYPVGHAGQAPA